MARIRLKEGRGGEVDIAGLGIQDMAGQHSLWSFPFGREEGEAVKGDEDGTGRKEGRGKGREGRRGGGHNRRASYLQWLRHI